VTLRTTGLQFTKRYPLCIGAQDEALRVVAGSVSNPARAAHRIDSRDTAHIVCDEKWPADGAISFYLIVQSTARPIARLQSAAIAVLVANNAELVSGERKCGAGILPGQPAPLHLPVASNGRLEIPFVEARRRNRQSGN
jgi:hypothetical protein